MGRAADYSELLRGDYSLPHRNPSITAQIEVLIGKKNDPFCFEAFPGNDSVGALCYRPQQGMQIYDSRNAKALKYSVQVKTKVGNLSSTVMHQGP